MKFVDLAKIHARSGCGGAGAVSFRREKFVEFGGPDGGSGGRGGSIYVEADSSLNTLVDFRYRRHIVAGNGTSGRGKQQTGASGKDVTIKVPVGTEVLDEHQEFLLFDLVADQERKLLLPGGNGGFGNSHFKSSTNQAPRHANQGQEGLERIFWLRLKLLADAGLLGLPNAGKSTFLSVVSNARPRIADYPFTTLHPILGTVVLDSQEFVLADIPGLIEGAHEGKGIGDLFLGHVERCSVLLHLVDGTSDQVSRDWEVVVSELMSYGHGLSDKKRITALTKIDALADDEIESRCSELGELSDSRVLPVSSVTRAGLDSCIRTLADAVADAKFEREDQRESMPWMP